MALRQLSAQIARLGAARAAALPAMQQRGFAAASDETFTIEASCCVWRDAAGAVLRAREHAQPSRFALC